MKEKQTAEEILNKHIEWIFASDKYKQMFVNAMEEYATLKLQEKDEEVKNTDILLEHEVNANIKYKNKIEKQAKEIEELTRSRDDVFHELEGTKEHNKQLQEEIERLKGERTNYLLGFIEWAKAVDEYGNKLNYIDVNNFLDNYKPIN